MTTLRRVFLLCLVAACSACGSVSSSPVDSGPRSLDTQDDLGPWDAYRSPDVPTPDDAREVVDLVVEARDQAAAELGDGTDRSADLFYGDAEPDVVDPCLDPGEDDLDQDGITAIQECADGTDPTDPAAASAWHPELAGVHPRLYFGAEDLSLLRARREVPGSAHEWLWQRLDQRCQQAAPEQPGDGTYDTVIARSRARIAQACAFTGLLAEDPARLALAAELLGASFPDPTYLNELANPFGHYDLHEAEALVAACSAWDYLAGAGGLVAPESLEAARNGLVARIDTFRKMSHEQGIYLLLVTSQNNHAMKVFGALGLCAMAVNDRPEAAGDLNEAYTGLHYLLTDYQSVPEGGYAEGWNYLTYGSDSYLPLLAAHQRYALGAETLYRNEGLLTLGAPLKGEVIGYSDLAADESVRAVYRLALRSAFPDGLTANTDDANPSPLHGAILAALFDDARFLWHWEKEAVARYVGSLDDVTYALHDPEMGPETPTWELDAGFPEAGFALLRSDLGETATLAIIQAENGKMTHHGEGHEHADPTSFLLHAHGEYLVLDPGYINWEHHTLVNTATDHNLVLVDGAGPPLVMGQWASTEAWLTDFGSEGETTTATVTTEYEGVAVTRHLVRHGESLFVVADKMVGAGSHEYTWQLNGHGGGETPDSGFELTEHGALWTRPLASLHVVVVATQGPTTLDHRLEEHATAWGQLTTHEVLTAAATQDQEAGFLAVVLPLPAGAQAPTVTVLAADDGLALLQVDQDGVTTYAGLNRTDTPATLDTPHGPVILAPAVPLVVSMGSDNQT